MLEAVRSTKDSPESPAPCRRVGGPRGGGGFRPLLLLLFTKPVVVKGSSSSSSKMMVNSCMIRSYLCVSPREFLQQYWLHRDDSRVEAWGGIFSSSGSALHYLHYPRLPFVDRLTVWCHVDNPLTRAMTDGDQTWYPHEALTHDVVPGTLKNVTY